MRSRFIRKGQKAVTLAEVLIGSAIASVFLGLLWFFSVSVHHSSEAGSARARYALDLTQLLETLGDDLVHARSLVAEEDESGTVLTLALHRFDTRGRPVKRVIRYRVRSESCSIERRDSETGVVRELPLKPPDGGGGPLRVSVQRETDSVQIAVGGQTLSLGVERGVVAPPGTTAAEAESWTPPETHSLVADQAQADSTSKKAAGAAPGTGWSPPPTSGAATGARRSSAGSLAQRGPTSQRGEPVPMAPLQRLADMPYQFVGGGDELRLSNAPRRADGASWFLGNSNLPLNDAGPAVPFLRRGNPLGQDLPSDLDAGSGPDWYTLVPNPARLRPGSPEIALDLEIPLDPEELRRQLEIAFGAGESEPEERPSTGTVPQDSARPELPELDLPAPLVGTPGDLTNLGLLATGEPLPDGPSLLTTWPAGLPPEAIEALRTATSVPDVTGQPGSVAVTVPGIPDVAGLVDGALQGIPPIPPVSMPTLPDTQGIIDGALQGIPPIPPVSMPTLPDTQGIIDGALQGSSEAGTVPTTEP